MAPGTIERLGLGYDEVKKLNPGIIYCQIKGFGDGSPYAKGLAFDMIAQAAGRDRSGVTGEPDRPPVKPGLSFGDTGTGMLMAATILGALHERHRTGKGRRLAGGNAGRHDPLYARPALPRWRAPGARRRAMAPSREVATTPLPACTRAPPAAPTITSTSRPAGPIPSTGRG